MIDDLWALLIKGFLLWHYADLCRFCTFLNSAQLASWTKFKNVQNLHKSTWSHKKGNPLRWRGKKSAAGPSQRKITILTKVSTYCHLKLTFFLQIWVIRIFCIRHIIIKQRIEMVDYESLFGKDKLLDSVPI